MNEQFRREYDFSEPLDDMWEVLPAGDWTWHQEPGCARLANAGEGHAQIFLRPCCGYGDSLEFQIAPGSRRAGRFTCGYSAGFEYIAVEIDLDSGALEIRTHEFHKAQPRYQGQAPTGFTNLKLVHEKDTLPGLPYSGSRLHVVLDGKTVATVGEIDFLPESLVMFGLRGRGEIALSRFAITGAARPRPEYAHVGLWQQRIYPTTAENVDGLLLGARQAAEAGVAILVTPETSMTGLRMGHPELDDRDHIQSELRRLQEGMAAIPNAPYMLVGYPDWVDGSEVEGATLDQVKVNCHRFVRPDGTLGPPMAKVHSCEEGFWHGRRHHLQRVAGVEVTMGVCHDGHYAEVWGLGVMGGARLCLHPSAGGSPDNRGPIAGVVDGMRGLGDQTDAFWIKVNSQGGSAIVYPAPNAKVRNTILALPADLREDSPTYPLYSRLDDQLAHATIRLWDASGCWPLRTLRSGARAYELWSALIPELVEV